MFNYLKLICSFLILLSCSDINPKESQVIELDLDNNTNGITIEEVIANLDNSGVVAIKKIEGSFAYYYSQDNIYKSIFDSDNKEYVYKIYNKDNKTYVSKTIISTGKNDGIKIEVLSGLNAGDKVVSEGVRKLVNNARVKIIN